MLKLICTGDIDGVPMRWSPFAPTVQTRPNGDLAVFDAFTGQGLMGFRSGGWKVRRRIMGYDIYDVDFGKRFQPRRGRKAA